MLRKTNSNSIIDIVEVVSEAELVEHSQSLENSLEKDPREHADEKGLISDDR